MMVAYPLLRVESKEVEVESLRGLPPGLLRPASIEPLDLDIDGDLSALWTAKAADLAQLAPQLPIGALQQRGRTNDFACHSLQRIVGNGLLKVTGEGGDRFRRSCLPGLSKGLQTSSGFGCVLGLINGTGLLHELFPRLLVGLPFEFFPTLLSHITQLVKDAALLEHCRAIHPSQGLP